MDPRASAMAWLEKDPDPDTRAELQALLDAGDDDALSECMGARLEFGTAGLRGVLGPGPSRMNRLVVRQTTLGLARYLERTKDAARANGVVIGYDGRRMSREFAEDAAGVLTAQGFKVLLFARMTPTPVTAFAVTHHGAAAGIMVTASHNPPEYNGYKVYWANGAQIIPPHDVGIAAEIDALASSDDLITVMPLSEAGPLLHSLDEELLEAYLSEVAELSVHPELDAAARDALTIAYTPMHGVGAELGMEAMRRAGFSNVFGVPEQLEPDGDFPTVRFPNPEEPGAMDLVLELAKDKDADIALANDPDADRLAVAVKDQVGSWRTLHGDQIGALLGADRMRGAGAGQAVAATIVSSQLLSVMAQARGVEYFETLTGFKWIANGAIDRRRERDVEFLFGYEEAIGFTLGELVRDKDGVSALVGVAELAASLKAHGLDLWSRLEAIYREFGVFVTAQKSLPLGVDGVGLGLMDAVRAHPPSVIGGRGVRTRTDLLTGVRATSSGDTSEVDLPASNVLVYHLDGGARVIVRPSGTEPKIKCYYEVRMPLEEHASVEEVFASAHAELAMLRDAHQKQLRRAGE
ncbi:MAG: phospho-sugar mutase [Myxococcota bacterium]